MTKRIHLVAICIAVCSVTAVPANAQNDVTTGSLTGVAKDVQGGVLPGATVTAVHEPTGTSYEVGTEQDGTFHFLNVRVGGPYTVTVNLSGFRTFTQMGIVAKLGEATNIPVQLQLATVSESVEVRGDATSAIFTPSHAGTAVNIPPEAIQELPTIQRNLFDFARTSPYFNATSSGNETYVTVAGRNNRYNSMQIDGAVNNDVFGIAATGTPGGQTGTQPVSLDAIQEIQLVVSPYDVRQGGFSGGGINAITKSGTNTVSGTGYYFWRNQQLVGTIPGLVTPSNQNPPDTKIGPFRDQQFGFSLGGPIVQNKAFFFGNVDWGRKKTPTGFSATGTSGQLWGAPGNVQQAVDIARNRYGYDPGSLDEFSKPNNSNKLFVRGDLNLTSKHQLTLRTNYIDSLARIGFPSTTQYLMPTNFHQFSDKASSTVGQLNSTLKSSVNELRVTYQRIRDNRGDAAGQKPFPFVQVDFGDLTSVRFGSESSSQANKLNENITELTDDFTLVRGRHTVTLGTHNEFLKFYNLFIQNLYGNYRFSSIANFQAGIAQSFSSNYSNTSDPLEAARFAVRQFGGYAGDQWRMRPSFTLTYGIRVDVPRFPDKPHANPLAATEFGIRTDRVPAPTMWSPRAGFNWDLSGGASKRQQLRGGGGIFSGRTPYVWLANQYANTGVDFTNLSVIFNAANTVPFVADPNAQPRTVIGGVTGRQTINLIDPDYKYPEIVRGNLAFDREVMFRLVATAELLVSKNIKDIFYQNLNYVPNGTLPDGRLTYTKRDQNLNDVVLLANTTRGSSWTTTFKLERPFANGFFASGSYLYNRATTVNDGTSSVARSNWAFGTYVNYDVNNPPVATSNYETGHRVTLTASIPIPVTSTVRSTASFYYNGQNGQPYTIVFNGDANGDGVTTNDIVYVPASPDQIVLINGTWDQLNTYINNDCGMRDHRGTIPIRNACHAPWINSLDFRYGVNIPTGGRTKVELTMDVFNLLNLLNKNWGWSFYPNLNSPITIGYGGLNPATGKETLNLSTIASPTFQGTFNRDDLRSRWQAQFGMRLRF
jgi:hypothetical protein